MIWVGRNFKAHHHGQGHLPIAQIAPSPTRQSGARAAPAGTPEPRSRWAGRVLGGKSTESRSGKCEQAPVRPVGGNSSSGGWVHPGGRLGSNFSSAEEGFSLAGSGEMCRENNLFLKILLKSRRSPPSKPAVELPSGSVLPLSSPQQLGAPGHPSRVPVPVPSLPLATVPRCRRGWGDVSGPTALGGWVILPSCQQPAELKLFSRLGKGFLIFFFFHPAERMGGIGAHRHRSCWFQPRGAPRFSPGEPHRTGQQQQFAME